MPDIKTLIQNIKIKNNLSRNDLAKILGVSSATVKGGNMAQCHHLII